MRFRTYTLNKMNLLIIAAITSVCWLHCSLADVSITIYNENLALVHESREFDFPRGTGEVRFTDVASQIIPTSVHFNSKLAVLLEQNYEYDLVSSQKLMDKYIDQEVELFTDNDKIFRGKLLSASGGVVIEEKDGSIRSLSQSKIFNVQFPKLPDGLITRPTLLWVTQSQTGGKGIGEVSYLTRGISWETEYVIVLAEDEKSLDMSGWVNITNNSGAAYKDTKIKLMAGDVNIKSSRRRSDRIFGGPTPTASIESEPQFEEKSFYEYHLYTLQRPSTLAENQVKQISLFPSAQVNNIKKEYRYNGNMSPKGGKGKVSVTLVYQNDKDNNLEIPLPKGLIRVYKADTDESIELIGEDKIDHTPRNEEVRISTGNAFDVVGERKQMDIKKKVLDEKTLTTYKYEIKVRNHKNEEIEVIVEERMRGDWEILDATRGWEKKSSSKIEWVVGVKPEEEKVIKYTVQITSKNRRRR